MEGGGTCWVDWKEFSRGGVKSMPLARLAKDVSSAPVILEWCAHSWWSSAREKAGELSARSCPLEGMEGYASCWLVPSVQALCL